PGAGAARLLAVAVGLGLALFAGWLLLSFVLLGLLLYLLLGSLFGRRGLDLCLDLVAEVDLSAAGILAVGGEVVLLAELTQLRGGDFELVGDPSISAALPHPGADLVELWLQRASCHRRASLFNLGCGPRLRHQERKRLEHRDDHDDHRRGQADSQHAEAHFAVLLVAGHAAFPRPVGGAAAQLLAATALQGRLLLEGDLELVDALTHSHRWPPGDRAAHRSKAARRLAEFKRDNDHDQQAPHSPRPARAARSSSLWKSGAKWSFGGIVSERARPRRTRIASTKRLPRWT